MKKWLLIAMLALSPFAVSARELKVGVQCTYPPFNFRDASGTLKGFEIDIARELGKRMKTEMNFVCMSFDGLIPALLSKKVDIVASSLSITELRKKSIDFSIPYRASTARFLAKKGAGLQPFKDGHTPNVAGLKGKVVGVQRSTTNDNYLTGEFPGVEIARYDSAENLLLDLVAQRIDLALVGPIKVEMDFLNKPEGKDYEFIGPELDAAKYFGDGVAVGLRKEDQALRGEINAGLQSMFDDGSFKAINQRYWSFSVLPAVWK
ncbi:transporter substrate-binding domain-containing protein [Pseudorhodoferax sp.]|uniref:transporter substrate-binding domain-containing protein n=1 Tax=Pseudorhodoferax sp. TaxID=1993553 RepID=UPI0039E452BC